MSELMDPLGGAKQIVSVMDADALAQFATWFQSFHASAWDAQIANDFAVPAILNLFLAGIEHSLPLAETSG